MIQKTDEKNRELSPAEKLRLERFEATAAELAEQGYRMTELTVGIVKANVYALLAAIPVVMIGMLLFF
ncbi:MAG: hypothetical protein J5827_00930, partial [Oscillospiraceae bacterium]|nr:hypothetical protein [Oscillospiraceae bacterium]